VIGWWRMLGGHMWSTGTDRGPYPNEAIR